MSELFSRMRINMKKLLVLLAALGLMTQMTACKANNAQDDAEFVENADTQKVESEDQLVADATTAPEVTAAPSSDNLATDKSLEAALGETPTVDQAEATPPPTPTENLSLDAAATETTNTATPDIAAAPSIDENSLNDVPVTEPAPDTMASAPAPDFAPAPPMDSTLVNDSPIADVPMTTEAPVHTAAKVKHHKVAKEDSAPAVKKINSDAKLSDVTPYAYEGGFVNTVYIARPKEKLKQISQTIYGSDKSKELKKINSFLKARAPRAGDKIFYVSPNRPSDSARMITYYEDTGMVPETYVAKKGENLRKIAKNLLGYDSAWKEVWATNGIETKSKLSEGDTFRYWNSVATVAAAAPTEEFAKNDKPQLIENVNQLPAAPTNEPALDPALANNPTPPPADMAANPPADLPPPPPADAVAPPPPADMAANNPPPPDMAPPPPPAPDMAATELSDKKPAAASMEETPANADQDMYTMLGIGVLVCGAVAFVLVRRKKKKAAEEMAMGETGVGI